MFLPSLLLPLLLLPFAEPAKILVTAPFPGSHYFAMAHLGQLLAEQGHSVYFASTLHDERLKINSPNFTIVEPAVNVLSTDEFATICYNCIYQLANVNAEGTMYADCICSDDTCRDGWLNIYSKLIALFGSPQFEDFVRSEKFDLVVAEHRTQLPLLAITHPFQTPFMVYTPEVAYIEPRMVQNLPQYLASEPGIVNPVFRGQSPGLFERTYNLVNFFQGFFRLEAGIEKLMEPLYQKYGVTTEEVMERLELFVINDHLAFSFPTQLPNNVLQIGGASLKPGRPLSGPLLEFLESHQDKSVLFLSVGTYTDFTWIPSHRTILESLLAMENVAVVFKVASEDQFDWLPADRIYRTTWAPQGDLLASGRISLFISHCGNNGKIETIFYTVPVLCIPIFADQSMNGNIVEMRGFGEMLLRSEINANSFRRTVQSMLQNHESYKSKMEEARQIFVTEPASGTEKLIYFTNLLLKYGNLKYLRNDLMKRQSFFQLHNLDVLGVLVFGVVVTILVLTKCILCVFRKKNNVLNDSKKRS